MSRFTDEERQSINEQNEELNQAFAKLFGDVFPSYRQFLGLAYGDGTAVRFEVDSGKNLYRYYAHPTTEKEYCWTPWKDTRGWYWAFNYVPKGNKLLVKDAVKFRKRKAAKQRATDRFNKDNSNA